MTGTPNGKGIFIWQGKNFAAGSIPAIVDACVQMGLTWVALKIADDINTAYASFPGNMPLAVSAFHSAGLRVWGWHYVYGGVIIGSNGHGIGYGPSAAQEAQFASGEVNRLGLDGYIIDAEKEWKTYNQNLRAIEFMTNLNMQIPIALCSYRFPSLHPEFPWTAFTGTKTSIHMPQVYWGPGNSGTDLIRSINELTLIKPFPIVPVGRAYIGDGNPNPTPAEITTFMETGVAKSLPGCSFWALDFLALHPGGADRQKAIAAFTWPGVTPPPPSVPAPIGTALVTASVLNVRLGPDTTFSDVGDLNIGCKMYVFELSGAWARIGVNTWIKTGTGLADYTAF